MRKLTTLTLIGAASALALSATAASAQMYDGRYMDRAYEGRGYDGRAGDGRAYDNRAAYDGRDRGFVASVRQRLARIDWQLKRSLRRGSISTGEAQAAQLEERRILHRLDTYGWGGYNRQEAADLHDRLARLEARVSPDRRANEYGYGYGRDYRNR
jgi:hypothetical protein